MKRFAFVICFTLLVLSLYANLILALRYDFARRDVRILLEMNKEQSVELEMRRKLCRYGLEE